MRLLADTARSFDEHMVRGTELNLRTIEAHVAESTMMVTALVPHIGYDKAAEIAHLTLSEDLSVRDAALRLGVDAELFDRAVLPIELTRPSPAD
ncbi:MAG: hypothetical protein M5U19_22325 [Microthrixaceae bacterium]|nr:hypothetical protein [Microthrixaceae bacterium]